MDYDLNCRVGISGNGPRVPGYDTTATLTVQDGKLKLFTDNKSLLDCDLSELRTKYVNNLEVLVTRVATADSYTFYFVESGSAAVSSMSKLLSLTESKAGAGKGGVYTWHWKTASKTSRAFMLFWLFGFVLTLGLVIYFNLRK